MSLAGFDDRAATYWSGRATLCSSLDDNELYDRAFTAWFDDASRRAAAGRFDAGADGNRRPADGRVGGAATPPPPSSSPSGPAPPRCCVIATWPGSANRIGPGWRCSSTASTWCRRYAVRCGAGRSRRGSVDLRRTLRAQLRTAGELTALRRRRPGVRPRRIVLLLDVSGSMQAYADSLLRLAHRIVRALPNQVEVFTIGTRLTRITPALTLRQPEEALAAAGRLVPDWSGGTRLGEVIAAFLSRWGRRGLARSAIVVIASDGWERGDARLLGEQLRQLRLLAYAVIWANPHRGKPGYAPIQTGILASLPHLDRMVAGHSLASFAELLEVLADV